MCPSRCRSRLENPQRVLADPSRSSCRRPARRSASRAPRCAGRLFLRPMLRSAQLTPFLTKLRSSVAAASISGKPGEEGLVAALLVVQREAGEQGEGGAPDELGRVVGPAVDHREGVRRLVEQLEAERVADRPIVEVAGPAVHLFGRQQGRIADIGGQHARLVDAGFPQRRGERMVAAACLADLLDAGHRHADHAVGGAMPYRPGRRGCAPRRAPRARRALRPDVIWPRSSAVFSLCRMIELPSGSRQTAIRQTGLSMSSAGR